MAFKLTRWISFLLMVVLLPLTWVVVVYHMSIFAPVTGSGNSQEVTATIWLPKTELGVQQAVLFGDPFYRGTEWGRITAPLLLAQEEHMVEFLDDFFPCRLLQRLLLVGVMRMFSGIEKYIEPWAAMEMTGVARNVTTKFNYLADPLTRQLAYHGLHEVGQMMVDREPDVMGCTVLGMKADNSWILGRNFDFEAGRFFDENKIMKWVFPSEGYAYLSVTWAGMVGVVTGVNEYGIYVSLNAAGSSDFRRFGTPTTLVLAKVLQFAKNYEEALAIMRESQIFITDIFILLDRQNQKAFRIEKSPKDMIVTEETEPFAATNHLLSDKWRDDRINLKRIKSSTTLARLKRAETLLGSLDAADLARPLAAEKRILDFLRDKRDLSGEMYHLGNRSAIDPLIATHSVIYNTSDNTFFVSQGPALVGKFVGFDLTQSFAQKRPIVVRTLPFDSTIDEETYAHVIRAQELSGRAGKALKKSLCKESWDLLEEAAREFTSSSGYWQVLGDYYSRCDKNGAMAREAWIKALSLRPGYLNQQEYLKRQLSL